MLIGGGFRGRKEGCNQNPKRSTHMIKGIHGLFYSSKPEELRARAFIRDKLKLAFSDTGAGWLIFDLEEGDLGVHPTDGDTQSGTHEISFSRTTSRARSPS
jgi:hypothetical protein